MNKLDEIMAHKADEIESRIRRVSDAELSAFARKEPRGAGFAQALANDDHLSVIAEIKRQSPSAGSINPDIDAAEQARLYVNAGADALSILTDKKYFGGSLQDLWDVADLLQTRESPPPALRKDFMLHPIQISRAHRLTRGACSDWAAAKLLKRLVGAAGIEPATPTV